jgi:hypothetical protein
MFVMGRLENEKLFGTPALLQARWHAIVRHPVAYLQHRATFQWMFLADMNLGMWSRDFDDPDEIAFADRPRLTARSLATTRYGTVHLRVPLARHVDRRLGPRDLRIGRGIRDDFFTVDASTDLRYAYWAVLPG